jgi:hypothetical protein
LLKTPVSNFSFEVKKTFFCSAKGVLDFALN